MTTPSTSQSSWMDSMVKYMGKALANREAFYKGLDEARNDFMQKTPGSPYSTAPNAAAAEQLFQNSPTAKEFISNNQWHMKQAIMFGIASACSALWRIAADVHAIRHAVEDNKTARIPTQRG